jgi:hypothetical protein
MNGDFSSANSRNRTALATSLPVPAPERSARCGRRSCRDLVELSDPLSRGNDTLSGPCVSAVQVLQTVSVRYPRHGGRTHGDIGRANESSAGTGAEAPRTSEIHDWRERGRSQRDCGDGYEGAASTDTISRRKPSASSSPTCSPPRSARVRDLLPWCEQHDRPIWHQASACTHPASIAGRYEADA